MKKTTEELINDLRTGYIKDYLATNAKEFLDISPQDFLHFLIQEKGLKLSEVVSCSGQGDYIYKVFKGQRNASRNIYLSLAFAINMSFDETQMLLRIAEIALLDPRKTRDSIIIYGLNNGYDIHKVNDVLFEMNEQIL